MITEVGPKVDQCQSVRSSSPSQGKFSLAVPSVEHLHGDARYETVIDTLIIIYHSHSRYAEVHAGTKSIAR